MNHIYLKPDLQSTCKQNMQTVSVFIFKASGAAVLLKSIASLRYAQRVIWHAVSQQYLTTGANAASVLKVWICLLSETCACFPT